MQFNWKVNSDKEVFDFVKATDYRKMKRLYFQNVQDRSKEVSDYLIKKCPDRIKIFGIEADIKFRLIDFYMKGIEKVVKIWI